MNKQFKIIAVFLVAFVSVYIGLIISLNLFNKNEGVLKYTTIYLLICVGIGLLGAIKLLSDMHNKSIHLEKLAYIDTNTGIPNKMSTINMVSKAIEESILYNRKCAINLIEFDYKKNSNNITGHEFGEKVIKQCISRLNTIVKDEHDIGMISDNEILVIVKDHISYNDIKFLCEIIIDEFSQDCVIKDQRFSLVTSIGISIYDKEVKSSYDLINKADIALSYIKKGETSGYMVYDDSIEILNKEEQYIKNGMIQALLKNSIEVKYQPIVSIDNMVDLGFEAQANWALKSKKIDKNKYMEIAEKYGITENIDIHIIGKVCNDINLNNLNEIAFSIKISPSTIEREGFTEKLRDVLLKTQIDTTKITLELNGNRLARYGDSLLFRISEIRRLGCKVSIDNIDANNSSLNIFNYLKVDKIKLDKSFVDAIGYNQHEEELIKSAIRISTLKETEVIANGVETRSQAEFLIKNNINKVQGNFFAPPIQAKDVRKYIIERKI